MKRTTTETRKQMKRLTRYAIIKDGRRAYTVGSRRIANRVAANMSGDIQILAVAA